MLQPRTVYRRETIWRAATDFIAERFHADLTVDEIAAAALTSPRQLQRVFAEVGGTTVREYVTELRMETARRLLTTTDVPISAIARQVGYRQPAHFAKTFGRRYGMAPSDLRFDARRTD